MFLRRTLLLLSPVLLLLPASSADARGRSRYYVQPYYHETGEYDVYVEGKIVKAEVLFSQRSATYLIALPDRTHAFVLRQRTRSVGRVATESLRRRDDGFVELSSGSKVESLGRLWLSGSGVVVRASGFNAELRPRPPLLKTISGAQMLAHSPQYKMLMRKYTPNAGTMQQLKAVRSNAEVEIFFGSWCSRCQRLLGRCLRVEQDLGPSSIKFKYYGLPRPPAAWSEPRYRASGVHGLPTAVVKVNGRLRGRIAHGSWSRMESALLPLVR